MTHGLTMTLNQMTPGNRPDLNDRRKPMQVNIEASGFFGDTTSLRRQRRRNRIHKMH